MSEKEAMRQALEERLQMQLEEWAAQTETLERKARRSAGDTRSRLDTRLREIQSRRAEATARLDELKAAGTETWDEARQEAERAWSKLGHAVRQARSVVEQLDHREAK